MWLEESEGERINNIRTDDILAVAPDIAAVACPFCLTMLKDGMDGRGADDGVRVLDIAEILAEKLQASTAPGAPTLGREAVGLPTPREDVDVVVAGAPL
jgi:hypothetical protein